MGRPAINIVGQRFGYLTVLSRKGTACGASKVSTWLCQCDCGKTIVRTSQGLRKARPGTIISCGCKHGVRLVIHGQTDSRMFRIWNQMKGRCQNQNDKDFKNYGARGITVCERWQKSFIHFSEDMRDGYSDELQIDRINNNIGYSPGNCRWATVKMQANNRRSNILIQTKNGQMTVTAAAEMIGIKVVTLHARIFRYGWDVKKAMEHPVRQPLPKHLTSQTLAVEINLL